MILYCVINAFFIGEDIIQKTSSNIISSLSDKTYAFEHICFEETKNLERLNNQLGYANKMNMRELRKLIKEYIGRFIDNMMTFNQEFYPTINDLLNTWTNIETFVQTSNASVKR